MKIDLRSVSLTRALGILLFVKALILGLSMAEVWASLVIFTGLQAEHVLSHLFPKRVDLYEEVKALKDSLNSLKEQSDSMDRDLTALKLSGTLRPK